VYLFNKFYLVIFQLVWIVAQSTAWKCSLKYWRKLKGLHKNGIRAKEKSVSKRRRAWTKPIKNRKNLETILKWNEKSN
jgi:hypothetical protein